MTDTGSWEANIWTWDLKWRRNLFAWEETLVLELEKILANANINRESNDRWLFRFNKVEEYTCKEAYLALIKHSCFLTDPNRPFVDEFFNKFWVQTVPLKVTAFDWQMILNRAPSRHNLWKKECNHRFRGRKMCSMQQ